MVTIIAICQLIDDVHSRVNLQMLDTLLYHQQMKHQTLRKQILSESSNQHHQRNRMMITQKHTVIAILTMIKMMQITIVHRLTWKVRMMHIRHNFSSQLWCLPVAMSTSSNLFQALKKSPVGVMAAGIFSTLAIVGTYRFAIRPILERRRREEAEAFAEYIFQQEKSKKTSSTF
uniref:Transmembrane protein n=1 Tax=Ceratitis capitata TaxID=7213 RepID=W8AX63_CERCA